MSPILRDDIRTLREAAEILHRHGQHRTAEDCLRVASTIAVDIALGDNPTPAPGNRLTRLTKGH